MAAALRIGQCLRGRLGTYTVSKRLEKNVWAAAGTNAETVVIKTLSAKRLKSEREILNLFQGRPHIRPMLDQINEPPALVLRYFQDDLLVASNTKTLQSSEKRFVAKGIFTALNTFHEAGYAHTDVKLDNIFVNYSDGDETNRFSEVALGDCGHAYRINPNADPLEQGHRIGAPIFSIPEANLELRWGTPTDIWLFGATLISLMLGENYHIFLPRGFGVNHPDYMAQVLLEQASYFGPFPSSYTEIANEERQNVIATINDLLKEGGVRKPFEWASDPELSVKDKEFILRIMKMDPRDRPTAKELLEDPWFN